MTSLRLPQALEQRLEQLAALTQRSKSFYIREALARHLDEMEDAYLALERISQPKRRFYSSEEVLKRLSRKKKS